MTCIEDVMTDNVVFVEVTATVREALRAMHDSDIRHLPVLDQGELVGMLSDRDLRASDAADIGDARGAAREVSGVMNPDVQSVTREDDLREAIDLMVEHRIGAVPVIDESTHELVGIVSYIDVLRVLRDKAD